MDFPGEIKKLIDSEEKWCKANKAELYQNKEKIKSIISKIIK